MIDKSKADLDAIFEAHCKSVQKTEAERTIREEREDEFLQSFYRLQESIVRPVFEEFGDYVKGKGYDFKILERKEGKDYQGRSEKARISLVFIVADRPGNYQIHDYPCFIVGCNKTDQKIEFLQSTLIPGRGGQSGGIGDANINDVNSELIQQKVVSFLKQIFK